MNYKLLSPIWRTLSMMVLSILTSVSIGQAQQQKADFGMGSKCLEAYAEAYGSMVGDSCSTIYWKIDGQTKQGNPLTYKFSAPGTYEICLKVLNTCSKWDTMICKKITVDTCPTKKCDIKAEINVHKLFGSYWLFKAGGNGTHFEWDFGDGNSAVGQTPWYRLTKRGYNTICLTAYNADKTCSTKVCKTVWVGSPCNIKGDFLMKHSGNGEYQFKVLKSNGYSYSWDFGDGHSGSGADPKHAYTKPGTYNICLTISSKDGKCKKTICKKITIAKGSCDVSKAQWGYSIKCKTLTVEHSNLNLNNPDSCWSYKYMIKQNGQVLWDAWSYSSNRFTYTFKNNGSYVVCIQFKNNCTGCDTIICKEVNVKCEENPCDWSRLQIGYNNKCRTYTFELGSYDSCLRYLTRVYYPKTQKVDTASDNRVFSYTFKDTGTFYMVHSLKNICTGCDTTIYQKINVTCIENNSQCHWYGTAWGMGNNCNKYTFEGPSTKDSCIKYTWKMGSNGALYTMSNDRVFKYTFNYKGNYTVCLTLTNTCKNCDTTICKTVEVNCLPCPATAKFVIDSIGAKGQVYLRNTSSNANTYFWDFGDSSYSYQFSPSKTYAQSGTYTICLKVYNQQSNCYNTYCKTITIVMKRSREAAAQTMVLYPNPAQESIRLDGAQLGSPYEIHNAMGQKVSQGTWTGSDIPVGDLSNGYYSLHLTHSAPIPFVVQHN